jgi:hypothetical protein
MSATNRTQTKASCDKPESTGQLPAESIVVEADGQIVSVSSAARPTGFEWCPVRPDGSWAIGRSSRED